MFRRKTDIPVGLQIGVMLINASEFIIKMTSDNENKLMSKQRCQNRYQ